RALAPACARARAGACSAGMLFRQLMHGKSRAFSYLVASRPGSEALLIDPVLDHLELYLRLLGALDLRLAYALDTRRHSEHSSALEALHERTHCVTAMGRESRACVVRPLADGELIEVEGLQLEAWHTPGHSADAYCFVMDDRVFTGNTLLIRSTGRIDQGGDARAQYASLFDKLLHLPGRTLVYPGHDYHGRHVSSIAEERRLNPRLQVSGPDEYVALMQTQTPAHPEQVDVVDAAPLRRSGVWMQKLAALHAARTPPNELPTTFDTPKARRINQR
ncbi:MAG TPA: MBL fold metallo-hydrolase, partial [Polyangiaceae bacterium]|nr:MBL fold metallo-hydrolase [Polyangiaceae bacterium]